jgi:hypothetical protein
MVIRPNKGCLVITRLWLAGVRLICFILLAGSQLIHAEAVRVTCELDRPTLMTGSSTVLRVFAQVDPAIANQSVRILTWYINIQNINGSVATANYTNIRMATSDNQPFLSSSGVTVSQDRRAIYNTFLSRVGAGVSNRIELLNVPVTALARGTTTFSVTAGTGEPSLAHDFLVARRGDGDTVPFTGGIYTSASVVLSVTGGTDNAVIRVAANPEGSGAVSGGGTFRVGSTRTISATPNAGFLFALWNDGITEPTRSVVVPAGGATFTATFSTSAVTPTRIIGLSGDLSFGNVTVGQTAQRTLTITNSGNSALTVSSISYPPGFSGAFAGSIAAGRAANVTVTFAPTEVGSFSGTITVNSDRTAGTNTRSCSGVGILTQGSAWDAGYESLNFGDWRRSPWFGDYTPMGGGWIFHNRHGFWFAFPDSTPDSIFFWSMDMGWLWTSSTTYTYLYRFNDGTWLYYEPNSEDQTRRWFLNMSNGQWESWPLPP